MTQKDLSNRQYLADLFGGPFRGHAIIMDPEYDPVDWSKGDFVTSHLPVSDWVPSIMKQYQARLARHEAVGDDAVPFAGLGTGTELFAAAFGCPVHIFEDDAPCALPLVQTAGEADHLGVPSLESRQMARIFELGHLVRRELGPDVPIGVPDIQSPFDIAALIWRKETLFVAMYDDPDAVKRLVEKCHILLTSFLEEFKRQFPEHNLCHCPYAWAPPELGCWMSEDEAGSMTIDMFEEFCLPVLEQMSDRFGGISLHCCATADHQYGQFKKIPNLRAINRVFQAPGPRPAIEAFSGQTVLAHAWTPEESVNQLLDMALPNTRFLFNMPAQPLEEAKQTYERLRERCPRCS